MIMFNILNFIVFIMFGFFFLVVINNKLNKYVFMKFMYFF